MRTQPVFAADRTFRRLREAGILSELRSTDGITIEVICGNWHVRVRGCAGAKERQWFSQEVDWDAVQTEADNPLLAAVERVAARLAPVAKAATAAA